MATCKDCLHSKVCINFSSYNDDLKMICPEFKDRNRFIELPHELGATVYSIQQGRNARGIPKHYVVAQKYSLTDFVLGNKIGETLFLTPEEAKEVLKERENND